MKNILQGVKQIFLAERLQSNIAIFIAISALAFSVSSSNMPCINADTCAVGSNEVFSGTLSLQNNTQYNTKLTPGSPTGDIVITLPSTTSTLATTSQIPSVPTLPASKIMATDGTGAYSTTDIYPLSIGTTGQVLTVNSGATALEYSSITGVPSLTASKSVATDGTGALVTTDVYPLSLTASKSLSTNASGNLETNDVYPLSLTASTPLKTNGSGEVTASDLDITTDITPGSALQEIRVNAGGTALEYFTPSGAGVGRIVASGTADMAYNGESICWQTGSMPFTTNGLDKNKEYRLMINWTENYYNAAIPNGGAYNFGFQSIYGDASFNSGRQCDSTTSGNEAYGSQGWHWNTVSNRQPGTCAGTYLRMEGTSSSECRYQNGYSPNYYTDATCNIMNGSMPSSTSSAYDYLSFDKIIIDFSSQKDNGIGVSFQYSVSGGFNSSDTTNSNYKATFSGKGSCSYGDANSGTTFESFAGIKLGMWNDTNQVYSDIDWVLIEYN